MREYRGETLSAFAVTEKYGRENEYADSFSRPRPNIKLLAIVEATNVNAVAKNVLEFHRAAQSLCQQSADSPEVTVSLVTFDRNGQSAEFVRAARQHGVDIDVIPERGRFDLSIIRALAGIVTQRAPDIVTTHQVKSHFLMKLSRLWQRYPWVAFNHGYTATDLKVRFYNQLDRWSLPKADKVITVCEAFARDLVENKGISADRVLVQHNSIRPEPPVSTVEVAALRSEIAVKDHEKVVLAVGRLSKEKGHLDLVEAFKQLCESNPELNAKLVIAGEGPEREKLEAFVTSLGIGERVIFAGHVSNVRSYYAVANVLANASHSEGSPYVLLEAMAAGVPVVATSVGGVPEIATSGETALLVPPRDPEAFARALHQLLTMADLAQTLSSNARVHVADHFSPAGYARSVIQIYQELCIRTPSDCDGTVHSTFSDRSRRYPDLSRF